MNYGVEMSGTKERIGAYGFLNALGLRGSPPEKRRLLNGVERAIDRGDWGHLLTLATSYGVGFVVGSYTREALRRQRRRLEEWVRW